MNLLSTEIFPIATYSVEDKCTLKIGEQQYETILTYTLYIEKNSAAGYDASIQRSTLKTGHQKIDTKFLGIANQYMDALFPLCCRIKEHRLFITNIAEIKQRIQRKDAELLTMYSGEGIQHIRTNFLNAIKDEESLRKFIKQLHFMKALSLGMQKFEKREVYQIQWNLLPIGISTWKGKIDYEKDSNVLIYEPKIIDAQEIMNTIIHYIHKYDYFVNIDQENVALFSDFTHKTNYTGETGRMKSSETKICIDIENIFLYEQILKLKSI